MALNRGKQFEERVKKDFLRISETVVERLPDQVSGYKGSRNVSDFIVYKYPNLFFVECKSTLGNTFPLSNLSQYDELLKRKSIKGVRSGVILWFIDHDVVCYVPIATFEQLKRDGKKSVNIKMLNDNEYRIIEIPSKKKRIFLECNFNIMQELQEGD